MADIITLDAARQHLRLEDDYPPEQLQVYVAAAWRSAERFLNRRIYATPEDHTAAILKVPAALAAAIGARDAALRAADLEVDAESQRDAREYAEQVLKEARSAAAEIRRGIVADYDVVAAILLILGHLFANREENVTGTTVDELKMGARSLLAPYRIGLGV